jgi:hypothetical protein
LFFHLLIFSVFLYPVSVCSQTRLKNCGLSEELIDLMRPTIERDQLNAVFSYLDREKLSALNEPQAKALALWLYTRIPILFRTMMRQANPLKSMKELNRMAVENLVYLMPGNSEEACTYFVQTLTFDPSTGRISKEDFLKTWNRHARLVFPSSHHKTTEKGTVYCAIL